MINIMPSESDIDLAYGDAMIGIKQTRYHEHVDQ